MILTIKVYYIHTLRTNNTVHLLQNPVYITHEVEYTSQFKPYIPCILWIGFKQKVSGQIKDTTMNIYPLIAFLIRVQQRYHFGCVKIYSYSKRRG